MSDNQTTTTIGQNQDDTTTTVVVTTDPQNPPVITIPCQDQNCSDPSYTTTTTATVAETEGGQSGLPDTGADVALLGGAAFCFVAFGVVLGRIAQRERKGLGR